MRNPQNCNKNSLGSQEHPRTFPFPASSLSVRICETFKGLQETCSQGSNGQGSSSQANPVDLSPGPPFLLTLQWADNSPASAHFFPIPFLETRRPASLSPVASFVLSLCLVHCPSFNKRALKIKNNKKIFHMPVCLLESRLISRWLFPRIVLARHHLTTEAPPASRGCPDYYAQPFHRSSRLCWPRFTTCHPLGYSPSKSYQTTSFFLPPVV